MTREHAPSPGATWDTTVRPVEQVVPDTVAPGHNELQPCHPNRETRRAIARAGKKRGRR
ncbi:hypothetical protein [Kitasatospora sp. NPDC004272]